MAENFMDIDTSNASTDHDAAIMQGMQQAQKDETSNEIYYRNNSALSTARIGKDYITYDNGTKRKITNSDIETAKKNLQNAKSADAFNNELKKKNVVELHAKIQSGKATDEDIEKYYQLYKSNELSKYGFGPGPKTLEAFADLHPEDEALAALVNKTEEAKKEFKVGGEEPNTDPDSGAKTDNSGDYNTDAPEEAIMLLYKKISNGTATPEDYEQAYVLWKTGKLSFEPDEKMLHEWRKNHPDDDKLTQALNNKQNNPNNLKEASKDAYNNSEEAQKKIEKDNERKVLFNKLLYGNETGSVNDKDNGKTAKAQKEQAAREFLDENPSLLKAIFSTKSGLNIGERAENLAGLVGAALANGLAGARIGGNGTNPGYKSLGMKQYEEAANRELDRREDELDKRQDITNQTEQYKQALRDNPYVKDADLDEETISKIANLTIQGFDDEEAVVKLITDKYPTISGDELTNLVEGIKDAQYNYSQITSQIQNATNTKSGKLTYIRSAAEAVNWAQGKITELTQIKATLSRDMTLETYTKALNALATSAKGLTSINSSTGSSSAKGSGNSASNGWGAGVEGHADVGTKTNNIGGSVNVDVNFANSSYANATDALTNNSGEMRDTLGIDAYKKAMDYAKDWNGKNIENAVRDITAAIDKQIEQLQAYVDSVGSTTNSDETLKNISRESDLQSRLGYSGKGINKDFEYYLTKLRG